VTRRGKTLGQLFPRAARRWPRTFLLGIVMLSGTVASVAVTCVALYLNPNGPLYFAAAVVLGLMVCAIRADIQDRKDQ
jgi:peptidoglycan/LPS O-acetylase OafA/YrhL